MFSLFLFLAVAVSASSVDHLLSPKKLFKDPEAFVSVFSLADKDTLNTLDGMVNKLLEEGKADLAAATDSKNSAESAHDEAASELGDAEQAKTLAEEDLVIKQGDAARLAQDAAATAATLEAATTKEGNAMDAHDAAATFKSKTIARTTSEKESLNQILTFLEQYLEASTAFTQKSNRQLLEEITQQFLMVEEDQVEDLYKMIQDLIDIANQEEADASKAEEDAAAAHDAAVAELTTATTAHSEASALSNAADLAKTQAENHLNSKDHALQAAIAKEAEAKKVLDEATLWLSDETARISEEETALLKVKELLEKLLETATSS